MTPDRSRTGPLDCSPLAVRVMPAERREWGRAMQAELAAVAERPERWSFAWGSVRAAAAQFHLLRGAAICSSCSAPWGRCSAWTATIGYPPLAWILYPMVSVLAAVCWGARRAGMLGPTGDGVTAWLLRAVAT